MPQIFRQFAIAVLLLTCFVCASQTSPSKPSKGPVVKKTGEALESNKAEQKKSTEPKPPAATDTLTSAPAPESEQKQHQDQTQREPYAVTIVSQPRDELFVTYVRVTAAGLLVGICTLIAVWYQTIKLREQVEQATEQTKATKKAADAARDSVDIAIHGERAWLFEEQAPQCLRGAKGPFSCMVHFANFGESPAW